MSLGSIGAIVLAVASTTLVNLAYLREHDAAAKLPCLSMRRPLHSVALLIGDRSWLRGFAMEAGGFVCYAGAVSLGSLALVQSIGAGGIGVLAFVTARVAGRRLGRRRSTGVSLSFLGLLALGVSLARDNGGGGRGDTVAILVWLALTALVALLVLAAGRRNGRSATSDGIAGGLLFSIGDLSTKLATQGGTRVAFVLTLIAGYSAGTSLLQIGYQRGGTLTVAGLATLLTNAIPIVAGTVLLGEGIPGGPFGVLRVGAFCAVIGGAILLASPDAAGVRASAS